MTKLEYVIKGLKCWEEAKHLCDDCCPYKTTDEEQIVMDKCNWPDLFKDARKLLQLQQPKILTLEEITNISIANNNAYHNKDATFIWIEEERGTLCICCPEYEPDLGYDSRDDSARVAYMGTDSFKWFYLRDYNKTWRCWTEKPTDEQRENIPWE